MENEKFVLGGEELNFPEYVKEKIKKIVEEKNGEYVLPTEHIYFWRDVEQHPQRVYERFPSDENNAMEYSMQFFGYLKEGMTFELYNVPTLWSSKLGGVEPTSADVGIQTVMSVLREGSTTHVLTKSGVGLSLIDDYNTSIK